MIKNGRVILFNAIFIIFSSLEMKVMGIVGGRLRLRMFGFPKIVEKLKNNMFLR